MKDSTKPVKDEGFGFAGAQTVILAILLEKERHAYDIAREIRRLSEDRLPVHFGTLYPTLYRMERDGLIASTVEQPVGERQRRTYCLTDKGHAEAVRSRMAWNNFATAMNKIVNRGEEPI